MPDEPVTRYCPSCGAKVKAPERAFSQARKCPKCQAVVSFRDYPNELPPVVPRSPPHAELDWFNYALYGSLAVCPVFLLIAVVCILLGIGDVALFAAAMCLVLAAPMATKYAQLKGSLLLVGRERDELRAANDKLRDSLFQANELAEGFRLNFDALVQDYQAALDKRYAKAEKLFAAAEERQTTVDALGARFLKDTVSNISSRLTPNNYNASAERLRKVIAFSRKSRFDVSDVLERQLLEDLRSEFAEVLRRQEEREQQALIKAQIREEQRAERELVRELERVAAEKSAIEKALALALEQTHDVHSAEVERLQALLAEAEAKAQRTLSMAQQTKAGHIYVISNLGSFGENVFKVGMTRRLEPLDRIKELSDASVPFPFDVHMMISCDDAPRLESTLHRSLHRRRINRVNLRKEFFRVSVDEIREIVQQNHGEVSYQATADAFEYVESQNMSDEDFEFLTRQHSALPPTDDEAEELEECVEAAAEMIAE